MPKTKISEFSSTPANNTDIDSINIAEGCAPSGINDAIRELMSQLKDWQSGTSNDPMVIGSSGSLTLNQGTANGVTYLNGSKVVTSGSALTFDGTNLAVTGGSVTAGSTQGNAQLIYGSVYGGIQFRNNTTAQSDVVGDTSGNLFSDFLTSAVWRNSLVGTNELMRLTSTGLGIGTSSPSDILTLAGGASGSYGLTINNAKVGGGTKAIFQYDATNQIALVGANTTNGLAFQTLTSGSLTTKATLDSSGNLGLGVTPSAWAWPNGSAGALQLQSGAAVSGYNATTYLSQNWYYNAGEKYIANGFATRYEQTTGKHAWYTAASGTAGNAVSWTQAMTLDTSGNLLVGITSANAQLHVRGSSTTDGSIKFNNQLDSTAAYNTSPQSGSMVALKYDSSGNYAGMGGWSIGKENATDGNFSSYFAMHTRANGGAITERARIDSSGNLLVGKTTSSSGSGAGLVLFGQTSASGYARIDFHKTASGTYLATEFNNNGTSVGSISYSNTATAYNTSSDYRLKNTIAPMTGALAKVALLKPCTYKWNADGSDGQGFIAHELAEVVPQCVTGEKDAVDENGNPKYQGIDTSFLVATLTAALQELNAKFDAYVASHP